MNDVDIAQVADDPRARARAIADAVLAPSAGTVDREGVVPTTHLDALADAGFYGLARRRIEAGEDEDAVPTLVIDVCEELARACLATAFVWMQHHGAVNLVQSSPDASVRAAWLDDLCSGRRRAGFAAALRPEANLTANPHAGGGIVLDGDVSWLTGWGRIDCVRVGARGPDDTIVWCLVDAVESETFLATPTSLVSLDATSTVTAHFRRHEVPPERVLRVASLATLQSRDTSNLRTAGALSLGFLARCRAALGESPLDAPIAAARAALVAGEGDLASVRASLSELALVAAARLSVLRGSGSLVRGTEAERLFREAQFLLLFGSRPAIRASLLDRLSGPAPSTWNREAP